MKNKSKLCSTGHGTGVIVPASLGTILERDKIALNRKRSRRALRTRRGPNFQRLLLSEKKEPGFLDAIGKVLGV